MIPSLGFFTSLTPLVCITLPFTQPCRHCSNSPAAFAVTTSRQHWHHHLTFLLHRFLDFCSTLCDFPLHRRESIARPPLCRLRCSTWPCTVELLSAPSLSLWESLPTFVIIPSCSHTHNLFLRSLSKLHHVASVLYLHHPCMLWRIRIHCTFRMSSPFLLIRL